jgi:diguanylate cyclase (GGDEF)-like protein
LIFPFPSACVRLDVDNFKRVNDTYGHAAGDEALRHIAGIIRRTVRERDFVYRISGDEFGVLCPNYTEEEAAGAMRRVCQTLLATPVKWVTRDSIANTFHVSVSIGVAEMIAASDASISFELADKASYASKNAGKGVVRRASQDLVADAALNIGESAVLRNGQ